MQNDRMQNEKPPKSPREALGPTFREWALLAISVVFCALALLIWRSNWRQALVTLALFGGCALTFADIIARKLRDRRFSAQVVRIAGSVDIPAARGRFAALAVGLTIIGAALCIVGTGNPWWLRIAGALIAVIGVALGMFTFSGLLARQTMRFDPDGIAIRQTHFGLRISWDNIQEIKAFEFSHNPYVGLRLLDPNNVAVDPPETLQKFAKQLRTNNKTFNVDIVIAPQKFGFSLPPLVAALARYVRDPSSRAELAPGANAAGTALELPSIAKLE